MQGVGGVAARQSGDVGQAAPPAAPCVVDFLHAFVSPLPWLPIVIQRLCVALTQTNWVRGSQTSWLRPTTGANGATAAAADIVREPVLFL